MKGTEVDRTQEERKCNRWEPAICPRADVTENDDHFEIVVELPGVQASDVSLEVEDDELRISGTRVDLHSDSKDSQTGYLVRERRPGAYSRVFRLGNQVDRAEISGRMTDGVLRVRLAKHQSALPRRIAVN